MVELIKRIKESIKGVGPGWAVGVRAKPGEWTSLLDGILLDAKGEPARFVPDENGGHIVFASKIWRPSEQ